MIGKEPKFYIIEIDLAIRPYYSTLIAYQGNFEPSGFPREIYYFKRDSLIAQKSHPGDFLLCPHQPLYIGPDYKILDPIKHLSLAEMFDLVSKDPDNYEFKSWDLPCSIIKRIFSPTDHLFEEILALKTHDYISPNSQEFFRLCIEHLANQQRFLDSIILKNKREININQLREFTRTFIKQALIMEEIIGFSFITILTKAIETSENFSEYMNNIFKNFIDYLEKSLNNNNIKININALKNSPWSNYANKFIQKEKEELKAVVITKKSGKYNIEGISNTSLGKKILKGLDFKTQKKWFTEIEYKKVLDFTNKLGIEFKIKEIKLKTPKKRKRAKIINK